MIDDGTTTILGPFTTWVLHPESYRGPQWRRVTMSVDITPKGDVRFNAQVRKRSDGADINELFNSMGFVGSIDSVFEDMLREVLDEDFKKRFNETPGERQNWISRRAGSRGAGTPRGGGSPYLNYALSSEFRDILTGMSNHQKLALAAAGDKICSRQLEIKSRFPCA